jgi:anti-sigma factor RsiW
MPRCRTVRENLTAWIDGELSRRWTDKVSRHLDACAACAAEAQSLREAVGMQRHALAQVIVPHDFDPARVRAELRRALLAQPAERALSSGWLPWSGVFRPVALAGALVTVAVTLVFLFAGGPRAILIPLGVESPPAVVNREPGLFKDYQLIEHLDALENFDTVESVPLDDDQTSQG